MRIRGTFFAILVLQIVSSHAFAAPLDASSSDTCEEARLSFSSSFLEAGEALNALQIPGLDANKVMEVARSYSTKEPNIPSLWIRCLAMDKLLIDGTPMDVLVTAHSNWVGIIPGFAAALNNVQDKKSGHQNVLHDVQVALAAGVIVFKLGRDDLKVFDRVFAAQVK